MTIKSSSDVNILELVHATTPPQLRSEASVVHVCSLCLRDYELLEDLRGHMLEYHKLKAASMKMKNPGKLCKDDKGLIRAHMHGQTEGLTNGEMLNSDVTKAIEIRPVAFKDFRLILRKNMHMRCGFSPKCPYKFENNSKVEAHAQCHVSDKFEQFKCFQCNLDFTNWRRCSAHLWRAHQLDVDLLQCPLCDFKSHASVLVWRHMRVHKRWRPRILRSMRAVQQRRQLKAAKSNEVTTVTNKNRYYSEKTCPICSRKFVNGKTLSKHVKTVHNKIKPFICSICGMKTARKASLLIHMRQHTGEKPLHCKICKFATRDPSVLHKHQLRHEKTGKFKCTLCNYTCIQTNLYKRHMRSKHALEYKKIACDICSYVTITEQKLLAHMEDHRRGLIVNTEDSMDATRANDFKNGTSNTAKNNADCFMPLESNDSLPHEPAVDTGGVTIPASPTEDTQFTLYLNN